jgi:hypothetical protein
VEAEVKLGWIILANYAEDTNGLLYVAGGGWDTLNVPAPLEGAPEGVFAAIQGTLVVRILFHQTEADRQHSFAVTLVGEDGDEVGRLEGAVRVDRTPGLPAGWDQNVNLVIPLRGVALPRPGLYRLSVLVDDQHLGDQPFRVIKGY